MISGYSISTTLKSLSPVTSMSIFSIIAVARIGKSFESLTEGNSSVFSPFGVWISSKGNSQKNCSRIFLRVGNFFTNGSWYYSDLKLEPNKYCDNNDLLFAWSASFGPKIWNGGRCIYHYHIWKILCSEYVDKEWLYFWLLSMVDKLKNTSGRGSTMIHITKKETEQTPLALPPIEEQRRIVRTIKSLFRYCDDFMSI